MILSIDIQLIIQVPAELRLKIRYIMAKMHKLTKGGQTIFPATIYDAVVNPKTRKSLATEMSGLNKGSAISTQFDTDFSKTRLGIPKENRSTGKILSYRNGATGELTVEMYIGTSMDDQYWSDDLFWCPLLPSTKFPFINVTAITGNNYNTPDAARNALPNTYNKKIGLVFTYRDLTNRYRVYLYNSETV